MITIDGPAGVGKSTAARLLAGRLGVPYVDTGATYRALAYAALQRGLDVSRSASMVALTRHLPLRLVSTPSGALAVRLNGSDVSRIIRSERVTEAAAAVAQHPRVRAAMVRLQRRLAGRRACVVEGRDTGSVVFPDAPHKFFLTATVAVRARRRQAELHRARLAAPSLPRIARQLRARDRLDRSRRIGPLVRPAGAIVIKTSALAAAQVVDRMLSHVRRNSHCAS